MKVSKKEKKAQRVIFNVSAVLSWYTAWLMANDHLPNKTNISDVANGFLEEDEDMVRRFLELPQREV